MAKCITLKRAQEIALDAYCDSLDEHPAFTIFQFSIFQFITGSLSEKTLFEARCLRAYMELADIMREMPPKRTKKRVAYDALAKYLRLHKGE